MKPWILLTLLTLCFAPFRLFGAPADTLAPEDGFLIVEVWVGQQRITQEAFVYYGNGRIYLPLDFLSDTLRLPLKPAPNGGVTGWIYRPQDLVSIDPANRTSSVDGHSYSMSENDAVNLNGEWYYATDFLGRIFDLTFEFDYSRQALYLASGQHPLPGEELLQKEQRRSAFDRWQKIEEREENAKNHGQLERDPAVFQPPFLDLAARYNLTKSRGQSPEHFLGYSANAFAVTGGFDTEAYVYDMDRHSPATIALKTSRYQEDGKMLGLFKKFEAGDIFSFSNPAVNYAQNGRGFKLSTNRYDDAESRTFNIRDALPLGWDVELYRDNELLGYQGSNTSGFFEFRDIPLLLGNNRFRLVFYGPQGQRREQVINYFYMGGLVNKGQLSVQTGFIEKNKYLVSNRRNIPSYQQGYNGQFSAAYGVTDSLTFNAAAIYDSVPVLQTKGFERRDKFFASAGAAYAWQGLFFNLQSVYDPDENGASADASVQTNWLGWDVTAQNIYYDGIITERNVIYDTHITNDTVARVNKTLEVGRFQLPVNYSFRHFVTLENQTQTEHTLGLYKTVWHRLYAAANYQHISGLEGGDMNLLNLDLNQAHLSYSFRAGASYDFIYNHLRHVSFSAYRDLSEDFNIGLTYNRASMSDLGSRYSNQYGGSLNWRTSFGYWSLDAGWSDQKSYYAYVGFNLSFLYDKFTRQLHSSPDKLYGTGALSADVFMDDNQNGQHDDGEKAVPNAELTLTPLPSNPEQNFADENGSALVRSLRAYQPYHAALDINKLDDSVGLVSPSGVRRFEVRPGQVIRLVYPVFGTGSAEGIVYQAQPGQPVRPMPGVVVRLTNAKTGQTAATRISEFDGYYSFEQLPLGTYTLQVDPRQTADLGLKTPPPYTFTIEKNEQLVSKDLRVFYAVPSRAKTLGQTKAGRVIKKPSVVSAKFSMPAGPKDTLQTVLPAADVSDLQGEGICRKNT